MNTLESHSMENPFGKTDECAKFIVDTVSLPFILHDITTIGQRYMFSFWIKSDVESFVYIQNETIKISTEWNKCEILFTATEADLELLFSQNGVYYIYHPKLEIGNTTTDWTPAPEDLEDKVDNMNDDLQQSITEQKTSIISDTEQIILSALESYVLTNDYDSFKETVSTQLQILSEEIVMKFTTVTEQVSTVEGDTQSQFNKLYKHITFSGDNGIEIHDGVNTLSLTMDTDGISFKKNGEQFGFWDGVDFYTGNIIVEVNERAQFGNYAFVPRSDNSLMFLKVR